MTIHHTDPFATPEGERSPARRLRSRLPAPVTLWTAAGPAASGLRSEAAPGGGVWTEERSDEGRRRRERPGAARAERAPASEREDVASRAPEPARAEASARITARQPAATIRAGITVSSLLVADGEPGKIIGLIDEESDFWATAEAAGVFAVTALTPADRQLADRFAGVLPAPGGAFQGYRWRQTDYGPVPEEPHTWAGCRIVDARPVGWALLVEADIEHVQLTDAEPLIYHRGRYRSTR